MSQEELEKEIAKVLYLRDLEAKLWAYFWPTWEKLMEATSPVHREMYQTYLKDAKKLCPILSRYCWLKDENQTRPKYSYAWASKHFKHSGDEHAKALEDMANFRKVIEID